MSRVGDVAQSATFNTTNGFSPSARLVLGPDGAFYGPTAGGGIYRRGNIYRFTTNGTITLVASFNGTNGAYPTMPLALANDGNLCGTTPDFNGDSGIFRLVSPPALATRAVAGGVVLTWNSFTNGVYEVDSASSLTAPDWAPLVTNLVASGPSTSVTNALPPGETRYYRLALLP